MKFVVLVFDAAKTLLPPQRLRWQFLFWALCANLLLAPAVYAASGVSRSQAYALGLLGLVTAALTVYLFVVMVQPEKF